MASIVCGTFHSFFNTFMMLCFIPHYRKVFLSIILRKQLITSSVDMQSKETNLERRKSGNIRDLKVHNQN